jgi:hypothetical protein
MNVNALNILYTVISILWSLTEIFESNKWEELITAHPDLYAPICLLIIRCIIKYDKTDEI